MKILQNKKNLFFALVTLSVLGLGVQATILIDKASASPPYTPTSIGGRLWQVDRNRAYSSVANGHEFPSTGGTVTLRFRTTIQAIGGGGTGSPIALFWLNADMNQSGGSLPNWSSLMSPPPASGPNYDDSTAEGCLAGRDHQNSQPPLRRYNCGSAGATVWGVRQLSNGNHATYVHDVEAEIVLGPNNTTSRRQICSTMHVGQFAPNGMNGQGVNAFSVNNIEDMIEWQSNHSGDPDEESYDQPTYSVSENFCFFVRANQEPVGRWEIDPGTCRYRLYARDPDNSSAYVHYRMQRKNNPGAGFSDQVPEIPPQIVEGGTNFSDGTGWIRPPREFVAGTYYLLKVRDINTGEWHNITPTGEGADTSNSRVNLRSPPICNEGPPPSELGICAATVHFQIPNNGTVLVRVFALREGWDANNPMLPASSDMVYNNRHGQTEEINLYNNPGLRSLISNEGFWVSVVPNGQQSDPRPGGRGTDNGSNSAYRSVRMGPCYSVTCDAVAIQRDVPLSAEAGWPGDAVKAGSDYRAIITLTNRTRNAVNGTDASVPGFLDQPGTAHPLSVIATAGSGLPASRAMSSFGPNEVKTIEIDLTAPNSVTAISLGGYPGFAGKFRIGGDCPPATVRPHQHFSITASSQPPTADPENPDIIDWITGGTRVSGPYDITANATSRLFRVPVGGGDITLQTVGESALPYGTNTFTHRYDDAVDGRGYGGGVWQPGDQYCSTITISPGQGWSGPDPAVAPLSPVDVTSATSGCGRVQNEPYLKTYGADVSAGGGFGTACNVNAGIQAFTRPVAELGTKGGSGGQFATFASGNINGFMSAALRTAAPTAPLGLSFANNVNNGTGGGIHQPQMGGAFGSYTDRCAPDFWNTAQLSATDPRRLPAGGGVDTRTTVNIVDLNSQTDKQTILRPGGIGQLTLNGGNFNARHALFVEGDVFINGNIAYLGAINPAWADLNSMTNFSLVVKGNIYISQNVTRLDGLYVAQPLDDGTKGVIYTCTSGADGSRFAPTQLWSQCQNQLRVFGSFVANHIRFLRTVNTISDSTAREQAPTSRAAEVFQVSPDSYLSHPVFRERGTSITGEYDYIATLPPVL